MGHLCPDEMALWFPTYRAFAIADGVIRHPPGGPLAFVPDSLIGEDRVSPRDSSRRATRQTRPPQNGGAAPFGSNITEVSGLYPRPRGPSAPNPRPPDRREHLGCRPPDARLIKQVEPRNPMVGQSRDDWTEWAGCRGGEGPGTLECFLVSRV